MRTLTLPFALLCLAAPAAAHLEMVEVSEDVEIASFGMDADTVEDLSVYDDSGNEIGEVEEVIGRDSEAPEALVIEFDNESDFGEEERIVPLDQVTRIEEGLLLHSDVDIGAFSTWED